MNNEDLQTALKESDLKGLNSMKKEIDLQDSTNSVDFFDQPDSTKPLQPHHLDSANINDLSEQIKEAEAASYIKEEQANDKAKLKNDETPQKVKIILHIPEAISREKGSDANTQEALDLTYRTSKGFLNNRPS